MNNCNKKIYYDELPDASEFVKEKCRHFKIDKKVDWDTFSSDILEFYEQYIPNEAMHGDIITTPEKHLRSMEVYFVNCVIVELDEKRKKELKKNYMMEKKLCQEDLTGSGYCCVPLKVSKKIKDPIKFYENSFTFENYDEIDFSGIEIDTEIHQDVIKKFTGGKPVDFTRKCFYFFSNNEWDSTNGIFII
jgi:hypothetical protein